MLQSGPFFQTLNLFIFFSIGTQVEAEHVLNRLWIGKAQRGDSGNYSCTIPQHDPEEFPRAKVRVHVMDGKFDIPGNIPVMLLKTFGKFSQR